MDAHYVLAASRSAEGASPHSRDDPPDEIVARLGSKEILDRRSGSTLNTACIRWRRGIGFRTHGSRFSKSSWPTDRSSCSSRISTGPKSSCSSSWSASSARSGPFLLVATARAEFLEQRPGWGARARSTLIELDALERAMRIGCSTGCSEAHFPPAFGTSSWNGQKGTRSSSRTLGDDDRPRCAPHRERLVADICAARGFRPSRHRAGGRRSPHRSAAAR